MKKVHLLIFFWTFAIAIPATGLALGILIFFNDYLPGMVKGITLPSMDWRGLTMEGSARSPEVAGMLIGLLVILVIIPITRTLSQKKEIT